MISPAVLAIMVGSLVLAVYFLVRVLCAPKEKFETRPKVTLFKASWCGHCKKFMPVWEEVSASMKDQADFAVVDADEDKAEVKAHGVKGFPTVVKEVNGERTEFAGKRTAAELRKFVESA